MDLQKSKYLNRTKNQSLKLVTLNPRLELGSDCGAGLERPKFKSWLSTEVIERHLSHYSCLGGAVG